MSRSKGFSLVELAVALAIIALLLAGALIPLSTQMDVRNVADTQRTMESIREAIVGFSQANGRLTCPAAGTVPAGGTDAFGLAAGTAQYNVAGFPNQCASSAGTVPWATLGVPEVDGWGRRFSYWVSPIFADALPPATTTVSSPGQSPACTPTPSPTQSSFALCSQGILTVNTRNEASHATPTPLGSQLPAVIVSHGKNGFGAYTPAGVTLAAPAGFDEIANANHASTATTFVSRISTPNPFPLGCNDNSAASLCEFDDIVVMIASNTLIARMVAAGRLP
jgi:prepilin-type N-terminal cleavage/methylation domain-containing protein